MLTLIALNGQEKGRVFELVGDSPELLGRQAPTIKLTDAQTSRRHAEILLQSNTWVIRDLGSTNGTWVNGQKIAQLTELEAGDRIVLGRHQFRVSEISQLPAPTPQPRTPAPEPAIGSEELADMGVDLSESLSADLMDEDEAAPELPEDSLLEEQEAGILPASTSDQPAPTEAAAPDQQDEEDDALIDLDALLADQLPADTDSPPELSDEFDELMAPDEPQIDTSSAPEAAGTGDLPQTPSGGGSDVNVMGVGPLPTDTPSAPSVDTPDVTDQANEVIDLDAGPEKASTPTPIPVVGSTTDQPPVDEASDAEAEQDDSAIDLDALLADLPDESEVPESEPDEAGPLNDAPVLDQAIVDEPDEPAEPTEQVEAEPEPEPQTEDVEPETAPEEESDSLIDIDILAAATPGMALHPDVDDEPVTDEIIDDAADDLLEAITEELESETPEATEAIDEPAEDAVVESGVAILPDEEQPAPPEEAELTEVIEEAEITEAVEEINQEVSTEAADVIEDVDVDVDLDVDIDLPENVEALADAEVAEDEAAEADESVAVDEAVVVVDDEQEDAEAQTEVAEEQEEEKKQEGEEAPSPFTDEVDDSQVDREWLLTEVEQEQAISGYRRSKLMTLTLLVVGLGVLIVAGWFALKLFTGGDTTPPAADRATEPVSEKQVQPTTASNEAEPIREQTVLTIQSAADTTQGTTDELALELVPIEETDTNARALRKADVAPPIADAFADIDIPVNTATTEPAAPRATATEADTAVDNTVEDTPQERDQTSDVSLIDDGLGELEAISAAMDAQHAPRSRTTDQAAFNGSRKVVYVVDASGSLVDSFPRVLSELDLAVYRLPEEQAFTVIFFGSEGVTEVPPAGLRWANDENKRELRRWTSPEKGNVTAWGRGDPIEALKLAISYQPHEVVILSDNLMGQQVSQEAVAQLLDEIDALTGDGLEMIHVVQFFNRDPQQVLKRIADRYNGRYDQVGVGKLEHPSTPVAAPNPAALAEVLDQQSTP